MATQQVLLLEDLPKMGRKGDIIRVKTGFFRNFLQPKQKALYADKNAVRMQERLQKERMQQAATDKKDAEAFAKQLEGRVFSTEVKVDSDGHMYGSVSIQDVVALLAAEEIEMEKKAIVLSHVLKKTGIHEVGLKLNEGVVCSIKVKITPEGVVEGEGEEADSTDESESASETESADTE
jgi:large subunit ribosomal protein L9